MENRIRIFIVEDEALIAHEIKRSLEGLGYEVCGICYDFTSAAAGVIISDADLFMLDINLGGRAEESGLTLAGLISSSNPKPFIFLTAYGDRDTIARATALHPANYLIKPVNPAALFAAIQLAIARVHEPQSTTALSEATVPDFFYVKIGQRKERLLWQDVIGMEAGKNYVRVYIKDRQGDYPVRGTIAFVLDQLVPEQLRKNYIRIGRGLCLNTSHITAVDEQFVVCGDRSFEHAGRLTPGHGYVNSTQPGNASGSGMFITK